ncbi:MAG: glycosyltransferase [Rhizobiaceae bacterium]|nr:glycosyltransferase [Rhizobiaceae bacterium]
MTAAPVISVVITAHNAAATIGATLRSIVRQDAFASGKVEIVLVDDRSTDGTSEAAKAAEPDGLRLIRIDRPSDSGLTSRQDALIVGFEAASGDIVLTLDADGIAGPDWIESMTAPILAGRADAVAGPVAFRSPAGMLGAWQTVDVADYLATNRVLVGFGLPGGVLFGNFAFRREWFGRVGGFERMGITLTEDLAFAQALHKAGARLAYAGSGSVEVAACASWSELIERAKRVSAGGISALSIAIGVRMLLLPLLALPALVFGGVFAWLFWLRYVLGVLFTAWALLRTRRYRLVPLALLYEPLAIVIGLAVMWRLSRGAEIEWGGRKYAR